MVSSLLHQNYSLPEVTINTRGFLSNQRRIDPMRRTTTTTASISTLITYLKEQDDHGNHIIGFFGIVTDDDDDDDIDSTTRVYDEVVIPPLNVMALSFTNTARAKIEKAGGKCISFHQLPLTFQKKFLSDFSKHHHPLAILKPNNNNNNNKDRSNQAMRNVRRRIIQGGGGGEYYQYTPTMSGLVMEIDDLLCEILIRLPAKTLGRLKVINKRWYSFVSDPSFVAKHTSLQTPQYPSGFLSETSISFSRTFGDINITLLPFDRPSPNLFSETTFAPGLPPLKCNMSTIRASCRGLLMAEIGDYIFVYNPLTKKKRRIPSPYDMFHCSYGIIFGGSTSFDQYDYNNQYTLVCLVEAHKVIKFKIVLPKRKRWSDSNKSSMISYGTNGLKKSSVCRHILPICYRGIIHWLTKEGYIIAFNLGKEESGMIEIPKSVMAVGGNVDWWNCTWLGVLEDEVNLVVATSKHEIETWVLHDYENNKWKIKRKDVVIKSRRIPIFHIRPLFFDGKRFLLTISTNIFCKSGRTVHLQIEHDVRTGVSKYIRREGHSSFVGYSPRFPIISTLTEV